MSVGARRIDQLPRAEALRLLSTVSFGRVVFLQRGQPAIRVVNHLLDDGNIIIRTSEWSDLGAAASEGPVVAYQVDDIDGEHHVGWSVSVRGPTQEVSDPQVAARYRERLATWAPGRRDFVIRIDPAIVGGVRLAEAEPADGER
jgi:nitroimidazol reductase NimA-like FMN-containing flavoprotein (pyridoxamine 5'-phosphate oxidase superfamily)